MASTIPTPSSEKFEETKFMKELIHLKDTQDSIQCLSGWCIRNRKFSYKITRCWLKCAKKVKTEQRLTLFYLLNDVVQHSKRKNYDDLLEKFEGILKEIMPYLKEEKICDKVQRCLNIWTERQVFSEKFVSELSAIIKQNRAEQDLIDNFQPQQLCTQIKIMRALEDDTDYKLKTLREADLNLVDMDEANLRQSLKDRQHGSDFIHDVDEGKQRLEQYIKAVDREINKRRQVIELLNHGSKYYESLLGEANIVANAYSNFGKRVKTLQMKLVEDKLPELKMDSKQALLAAADLSPIPSPPDYDAPSPQSGELELVLPDEQQTKQQHLQKHFREKTPEDLNSRLDSMRSQMAQSSGNGPSHGGSISEFLTKLATGDDYGHSVAPVVQAPVVTPYAAQIFPPPVEQDQAWWDPPPATSWPAPKPDPWTESVTEPIPEWQIQTEDDVPDDDGDEGLLEPEVYTQNLALQRLQQNAAKRTVPVSKLDDKVTASTNNLIDLTSGGSKMSGPGHMGGGTEDMEMCSDEDDEYGHHHQSRHNQHHQQQQQQQPQLLHRIAPPPPPPPQVHQSHPPPDFARNGSSAATTSSSVFRRERTASSSSYHEEEKRTLSLQERLKNLAGIQSTDDDSTFFSTRSVPLPIGLPPTPSAVAHPPPPSPSVFSPHRPPPPRPPPQHDFRPRGPAFDQRPLVHGGEDHRSPFQSGFQPRGGPQQQHHHRPRLEHHENNFHGSPMRGRARPPGPRW